MKHKNKADLNTSEFVYYDENKNVEVWRTQNGKLFSVKPMCDAEKTISPKNEFEYKKSGYKVYDEGEMTDVDKEIYTESIENIGTDIQKLSNLDFYEYAQQRMGKAVNDPMLINVMKRI